jgi:hypothetical protein
MVDDVVWLTLARALEVYSYVSPGNRPKSIFSRRPPAFC